MSKAEMFEKALELPWAGLDSNYQASTYMVYRLVLYQLIISHHAYVYTLYNVYNYTLCINVINKHSTLTTECPPCQCSSSRGALCCTRCPAGPLRSGTPPQRACRQTPGAAWSGVWRWRSAAPRHLDPHTSDCSACSAHIYILTII